MFHVKMPPDWINGWVKHLAHLENAPNRLEDALPPNKEIDGIQEERDGRRIALRCKVKDAAMQQRRRPELLTLVEKESGD